MDSALMQNQSEIPKNGTTQPTSESKVQFIKIDDGHVLARITRGNTVVEAIISTVPPESSGPADFLSNLDVAKHDAP